MSLSLRHLVYAFREGQEAERVSENFTAAEFKCHDGSPAWFVSAPLVVILEAIRKDIHASGHRVPLKVVSGYRTPAHNKSCGGEPKSFHLSGLAADVAAHGVSPADIARLARKHGAGGVGVYGRFCHVDVGPVRSWKG